jgi:hypothetical protein
MPALLALALGFGSAAANAQAIPRAPRPAAGADASLAPILKAARAALAAGDGKAATSHLLNALARNPASPEALALLLTAKPIDADVRAAVLLAAAPLLADGRGAFDLTKEAVTANPAAHAAAVAIEALRAQAGSEIVGLAKRYGAASREIGAPVLARVLRDLYLEVAGRAPAGHDGARGVFDGVGIPRRDSHQPFVNALARLALESLASKKISTAILAARCLRGICAQAALPDLKGPPAPNLDSKRLEAEQALARARDLLLASTEPYTVEQLEAMTEDEAIRFTLDHSGVDRPAIAISPTGLYRLETICGHATLVHALRTIELHHARLARWLGKDPFTGRQGVVRIVPEADDLEAEGTPYWWAGGFQSGDLTVLRFNASQAGGLDGGLTHELTHRFDSEIHGGLPGWLGEGRAVWTGAAFGNPYEDFIANHVDFGAMDSAMRKGYGGREKLEKLIAGTIDDYRDNYVAGYALFVYLTTWEEPAGKPLFASPFARYLAGVSRAGKKPVEYFTQHFCDGKDGRPKTLEAFAAGFDTFLNGFYWLDPKPFTKRYVDSVQRPPTELVYDAPTWQFSRQRAEPWFGQDQAAAAGDLLASCGMVTEAAHAYVYGFQVDEFDSTRALALAALLEQKRETLAARSLRSLAHRRDPDVVPVVSGAPLAALLPRTTALAIALNARAAELEAANLARSAAALRGDGRRLQRLLALDPTPLPAPIASPLAPPFSDVPRDVSWLGLREDELTDYEEHRVKDLWYETETGDLHVGRTKPRDATGELDRNASLHHVFVRGNDWLMPGRYRVKGRIHFTTTYVDGAIVFGYTRRDRHLRFTFKAGDYMYSIGEAESASRISSVDVSLSGIRDGEGAAGRSVGTKVDFDSPKSSFDFEVLVDGPLALAFVDSQLIGCYATPDGQPIEGYFGFASSFGAYRVERASSGLEHRNVDLEVVDPLTMGLTLDAAGPVRAAELIGRRVRGIPVHETGSILVWVPLPEDHETLLQRGPDGYPRAQERDAAMYSVRAAVRMMLRGGFDPPMTMALPSFYSPEDLAKLQEDLKTAPEFRGATVLHHKLTPLLRPDRTDLLTSTNPMLIYVDDRGIARAIEPFKMGESVLPNPISFWLRFERSRVRPPETAIASPAEDEPEDDEG